MVFPLTSLNGSYSNNPFNLSSLMNPINALNSVNVRNISGLSFASGYNAGNFLWSYSACYLFGWVWMDRHFSIERILKR